MRNLAAPLNIRAVSLVAVTFVSIVLSGSILPVYASAGIVDDSIWTRLNAAKDGLINDDSEGSNNAQSVYEAVTSMTALGIFLGSFGVLAALVALERRSRGLPRYGSL